VTPVPLPALLPPDLAAPLLAAAAAAAAGPADGASRIPLLMATIFVFVLAVFVGFELITKVPATLHTPLMSGSNAISGITIVGAMICAYTDSLAGLAPILGVLAIIFAMTNVVGGFLVTDRMLRMFRRR